MSAQARPSDADLEYLSWLGYSPLGVCPKCGTVWTDVMFAYDGSHCRAPLYEDRQRQREPS
jgi:hypothetical protein